jgi:periplasmic protein CpxP/Spy
MDKIKLLTIAVIGLLAINLGTLGFLLMNGESHKPGHNGRPEPKEVIIHKLHFDPGQQKEYGKLIDWHRGEIARLDDNIRKAKYKLYSQLSQAKVTAKTKDSLIAIMNLNQKQIEETHFRHFEDIKRLCHKDQLDDFNALTEELPRLFAPKPHRPRHD